MSDTCGEGIIVIELLGFDSVTRSMDRLWRKLKRLKEKEKKMKVRVPSFVLE